MALQPQLLVLCVLILGAVGVLADLDITDQEKQQHIKTERSGPYYLHELEKAKLGFTALGSSGLTLLLPILLALGFIIAIIPIVGLLFTTGLTGFGYGGYPGGLYPAGRKRSGDSLLSQENVIKMVTFVDKALQDFGKQINVKKT